MKDPYSLALSVYRKEDNEFIFASTPKNIELVISEIINNFKDYCYVCITSLDEYALIEPIILNNKNVKIINCSDTFINGSHINGTSLKDKFSNAFTMSKCPLFFVIADDKHFIIKPTIGAHKCSFNQPGIVKAIKDIIGDLIGDL